MTGYPKLLAPIDHVEPVPRRIRATLGGALVLDTVSATYVWEHPYYPQYYIPLGDIAPGLLVDEGESEQTSRGTARRHALRVGEIERPGAALVYGDDAIASVAGMAHFDWPALDAWYEEEEQVFIHPRSPYTRVDALRSNRRIQVARDGHLLAESASPVMVFETGLPTRYYIARTDIDFTHLEPSETVTGCPYKGMTSAYWSFRDGQKIVPDLAWAYDFPTTALAQMAGMIAFYNERVDITLDGVPIDRPTTPFT
ncbi:MAG TPA: DUF427 domain-containing protein [Conexibacter sp.]|jgi:uncharacterized protein (DUF427 family)